MNTKKTLIHMGQKSFVEGEVGIKVRLAYIGERKWKDRWPTFQRCIVSKVWLLFSA